MKKTIGKPENWQDFESLCKKLWGEVWEIPNTIKKNGRLGQEQSGVDVTGIPKGESEYWGIQCKGKDEYSHAKLKIAEVSTEINEAKNFNPKLIGYIIATTANKDAKIEEFIREKNIEHQTSSLFEVHIFCWEDIVDLLEEHPNVLSWYLHGIGQQHKFDFKISFNKFEDQLVLKPKFERLTTKHVVTELTPFEVMRQTISSLSTLPKPSIFPGLSNKINKSYVEFDINMENIGSTVIEDWYCNIRFRSGVESIDDGSSILYIGNLNLTTHVDNDDKTISYKPRENRPLVQTDNRYFTVTLLPELNSDKIIGEYEIVARNFNKIEGFEIELQPEYIDNIKIEQLPLNSLEVEDEISINYLVENA